MEQCSCPKLILTFPFLFAETVGCMGEVTVAIIEAVVVGELLNKQDELKAHVFRFVLRVSFGRRDSSGSDATLCRRGAPDTSICHAPRRILTTLMG